MIFYNSLSGKKEVFKSINQKNIKIYFCGITVYDECHIGHARTNVIFDVINRYFKYRGFKVTLVRNITDIDDKIINKATKNGESINKLVNRNIKLMQLAFNNLNILKPTFEPRATHNISEMISMIKILINKGYAYKGSNGDILYNVSKFVNYGKLSKQNFELLKCNSKINNIEKKDNMMDFTLWKIAKIGEPSWESPWGLGRPGWHIECSAMSKKYLGSTFDIHVGGFDLKFPHHENEIAQSEACNECNLANYWLHVGMLKINNKKMSKSLNNFFSIHELIKQYHPEVIRFFLISTIYRNEINYSIDNLNNARMSVNRLFNTLKDINPIEINFKNDNFNYEEKFIQAMDNDFNTPKALSILFNLVKKINILKVKNEYKKAGGYAFLLYKLCNVLGILFTDIKEYFKQSNKINVNIIENLIIKRSKAKKNKNYDKADKIRNYLYKQGIILEDNASGTIWKRD